MSSELSGTENTIVGVVASTIVGLTLQPTVYFKNAKQQNLPLTLDPRKMYRGIGPSLANEVGQMGLQFAAAGTMKKIFPATSSGEFAAAAGAGALVALFAAPCELLMIQQQRHNLSLLATPVQVVRDYGMRTFLGRGLGLCMLRDAISVGGMLGATPVCHRFLLDAWSTPSTDASEGATAHDAKAATTTGREATAVMLASMLGGTFGACLSQPFDVAKTCMQGDLGRATYGGALETMRALVRDGGVGRLFSGVEWRTVNIIMTVWIANECLLRLPPHVKVFTRHEDAVRV